MPARSPRIRSPGQPAYSTSPDFYVATTFPTLRFNSCSPTASASSWPNCAKSASKLATASPWIPNTSSPGSKRTTPKPISLTAMTRTSSPPVIQTAALDASAAEISELPHRNRLLRLATIPNLPIPSPSASSTGAMLPVWWPPKSPVGENSSWLK